MAGFFDERELDRLAKRMQRGDSQAAALLYDRLAQKVFGFCMNRVGNRSVAEDLTQDIFLKLVRKIDTFDAKRGRFAVWFWQLARNTVTDYYRERKEMAFADLGDERLEVVAGTVSHGGEDRWQLEQVRRTMQSFTSEEQELFELRFVADLSYQDIARLVGKSEGALRVAVNRLRSKLQSHFQ